eukprot:SAG11_NODE_24690_length_369_cov_1.529630_1_plen_78_part_01
MDSIHMDCGAAMEAIEGTGVASDAICDFDLQSFVHQDLTVAQVCQASCGACGSSPAPADPCDPSPCQNGGQCEAVFGV